MSEAHEMTERDAERDAEIVMIDDSSGEEIVFSITDVPNLIAALRLPLYDPTGSQ